MPASAVPTLSSYAREGWVFVAARLAQAGSGERLEPTPLVLKFKAERPVYPMRLTGVGNGALALDLCVLADGTAYAPGMVVARSSPLSLSDSSSRTGINGVPLRHEGLAHLAALAGSPTWITRLSGTLSPAAQRADMDLEIGPPVRANERLFTPDAASLLGFNIGAAAAGIGVFALSISLFLRSWSESQARVALLAVVVVGTLTGFAAAAAVPRYAGEVRTSRRPFYLQRRAVREAQMHSCADLAALRADIARWRAAGEPPFSDLPEEGDRPWGYSLRMDADGNAWIQLYDQFGGPAEMEPLLGVGTSPADGG